MKAIRYTYVTVALAAGLLICGAVQADLEIVDGDGRIVRTFETIDPGSKRVRPTKVFQYEAGGVTVTHDVAIPTVGTITVTEYGTVVVELESGEIQADATGSGAVVVRHGDKSIATSDGRITVFTDGILQGGALAGTVLEGNALVETETETRAIHAQDGQRRYATTEEGLIVEMRPAETLTEGSAASTEPSDAAVTDAQGRSENEPTEADREMLRFDRRGNLRTESTDGQGRSENEPTEADREMLRFDRRGNLRTESTDAQGRSQNEPTEADRSRAQRLWDRMKETLRNMGDGSGEATEQASEPGNEVSSSDRPGPWHGFSLGVTGQFGTLDTGRVGGTSVIKPDGGMESATVRSPGEVDVSGFGLTLGYNTGTGAFWDPTGKSSETRYYGTWHTLSGDGQRSRAVPPGQAVSAFLFQGLADGGFTGVLLGDSLGINSTSRVEYEEDTFLLGTRWRCEVPELGDLVFEPGVALKLSAREWGYESIDSAIRLPDIRAQKSVEIDEDNTYLRTEARLGYRLNRSTSLSFGAGLDIGRVKADMDFAQWAACPSCPMPDLRDVRLMYSDSESETVVDPFATMALKHRVTPNLTVGASWTMENRSQARVAEALTGDQVLDGRQTELDIGSESSNLLRLSVRLKY